MNPLVIVVLIVLALLGAYLLLIELAPAQLATGTFTNPIITSSTNLAIKILIAVVILYAIYYVVDVFKTSTRERKDKARRAQERKAREESSKF